MFTKQEKENLKMILTEGLDIVPEVDIKSLTIKIWENIARLPHPIDSNFNIIGKSSIVYILNESKENLLLINIHPDKLHFEMQIPEYKFTRSDKMTTAFAAWAVAEAWTQETKEAILNNR